MREPPSEDLVRTALQGTVDQLRHTMSTGRFTSGLALEITMATLVGHLNMFRVIDEIAIIEGKSPRSSSTKSATPFTRRHLKGFWHKHYTQASYMAKNIHLEMLRDGTIDRVWTKYEGQITTSQMVQELTNAVVNENYLRRSQQGRLTGEWIVFKKTAEGNVYLTLASHQEKNKSIADRITAYQSLDLIGG